MGGADVIRQALRAGLVEELSISIAPVVLGGGKRLFDEFDETVSLEHLRLLQSPFATHITYRMVRRPGRGLLALSSPFAPDLKAPQLASWYFWKFASSPFSYWVGIAPIR